MYTPGIGVCQKEWQNLVQEIKNKDKTVVKSVNMLPYEMVKRICTKILFQYNQCMFVYIIINSQKTKKIYRRNVPYQPYVNLLKIDCKGFLYNHSSYIANKSYTGV